MRIAVLFQFAGTMEPKAVTEVEGDLCDVLLPMAGDAVSHRDFEGRRFEGEVLTRHFDYALSNGPDATGSIVVTLLLRRLPHGDGTEIH